MYEFIVRDINSIRHKLVWVHRYEIDGNDLMLYRKYKKQSTVTFHLDKIIYYGFFDKPDPEKEDN